MAEMAALCRNEKLGDGKPMSGRSSGLEQMRRDESRQDASTRTLKQVHAEKA